MLFNFAICFSLLGFFEVGNGGPRLDLELADFNKEEATSWSVIKKNEPSSKPRSFADAVKSGLLSGANYGMHLEEIPNRLLMVRAVASSRSQPQNKNVAIATINRLPDAPGPGFEGESWTIQCEVIQREMLGAGPPNEDPLPAQLQIQGNLSFDFFGLGAISSWSAARTQQHAAECPQ